MSGCARFVLLLSARIDGALGGAQLGPLEEHLAVCPSCRARELALLAQGEALRSGAADRLDVLEASGQLDLARFTDRVMSAIDADARSGARPARWSRLALTLRERWAHQRLRFSASLGVALAGAAAALLLLVLPHAASMPSGALLAQDVAVRQAQASVEKLELTQGTTGVVLEVPGQPTVIWLSDEAAQ